MASMTWGIAFLVILMAQVATGSGNAAFLGAMVAFAVFFVFVVFGLIRKRRKPLT